jgi:RHS repeat-associated protein
MFGYCGNLGHPTDPESGLIYMRARFYEPWTGRFLSEDRAGDGKNLYIYVYNMPPTSVDQSGQSILSAAIMVAFMIFEIWRWTGSLEIESAWSRANVLYRETDIQNLLPWSDLIPGLQGYWPVISGVVGGAISSVLKTFGIAKLLKHGLPALSQIGNSATKGAVKGGVLSTVTTGIALGTEIYLLGYAYQLRLGWYIDYF